MSVLNLIRYIYPGIFERWKIITKINYEKSYRTNVKGEEYIVLYLTIFNQNDFELKKITFKSEPLYELKENIYKEHIHRPGDVPYLGTVILVSNSFGVKPIKVDKKDNETGALIFKIPNSECKIEELIINFQTMQKKCKVDNEQITRRKID